MRQTTQKNPYISSKKQQNTGTGSPPSGPVGLLLTFLAARRTLKPSEAGVKPQIKDDDRGQGKGGSDQKRGLRRQAIDPAKPGNRHDRSRHLQAAKAEDQVAHHHQAVERQFDADQEHQQQDTSFGKGRKFRDIRYSDGIQKWQITSQS